MNEQTKEKVKPKYKIDIEGTIHSWDDDNITVPQLRLLGGLPEDTEVVEVDLKDNTERTLAADEVVTVKSGKGFAKKVRFKRG